ATTAGGVSLVNTFGPDAVRPRPASDLICADSQDTRVCVWPEHASRLAETARTVSTAVADLRLVGVTPPAVVTESNQHPSRRQWTVTVKQNPTFTGQDILAGITADLTTVLVDDPGVENDAHCPADPVKAAQQAFASEEELRIWLSVRAGMNAQETRRRTDPQTWGPVAHVLDGSVTSQKDWFRSALGRARCMPR
ncbi:DUF7224 domain-containing protein, partial [Streptomyces nodosus]